MAGESTVVDFESTSLLHATVSETPGEILTYLDQKNTHIARSRVIHYQMPVAVLEDFFHVYIIIFINHRLCFWKASALDRIGHL